VEDEGRSVGVDDLARVDRRSRRPKGRGLKKVKLEVEAR
jgi:hypothetical protein